MTLAEVGRAAEQGVGPRRTPVIRRMARHAACGPGFVVETNRYVCVEDLTDDQFDKLWNVLADHDHLADLPQAWSAKEDLRHILAPHPNRSGVRPTEADVADRRDAPLAWCEANRHLPELASLRQTLTNRRQEIFNAVLTGASNAASEGVNRIQKLDARAASGYRNPTNQRRRARIATLRSKRRSQTVTPGQPRRVAGPQPVPG